MGSLTPQVLEHFVNRQLANIGANISQVVSLTKTLSLYLVFNLNRLTQVDFPSSAEMHRTVVNAGVDAELDNMKRTYDGIEDLLNQISQTIAADVPQEYSLDLNVIFFPQIGFLISMPINAHTGKSNYEGSGPEERQWDRVFSTSSRVYYKDFRMRELDETLGDMYAIICGELAI